MKRVMKRITELERVINNPLTTMSQRHRARTGLVKLTGVPYTSAELADEIAYIAEGRSDSLGYINNIENQAHSNLCYALGSWL